MSRKFGHLSWSAGQLISMWLAILIALPQLAPYAISQQRSRADSETVAQMFAAALAAYRTKRYSAAQVQLLSLLKNYPDSFDVNELLGLVYVAENSPALANRYLMKAVQLKPSNADARTALATNLLALHRTMEAEAQFSKVAQMAPDSFDANHNLGELYIQSGRISDAIPWLRRAQRSDPSAYNNGYDLALALEETGQFQGARAELQKLVEFHNSAELHSLLGDIDEQSRDYISSAQEYEKAAQLEPSEQNLFNWGAELLLHQAFPPAIAVFQSGIKRFPRSVQLHSGLGIAFYGAAKMNDAIQAFSLASDLAPADPMPLKFMGKACNAASPELAAKIQTRLRAFLKGNDQSADLNYDLAACLLKFNEPAPDPNVRGEIESLLNRVLEINPSYGEAYFALGNLYAAERRYGDAVEQYEHAAKLDPGSANIHYRLGQALARAGDRAGAKEQFATFQRLLKAETAQTNKEQSEIQQFVFTMRKDHATQAQ